MIQLKAFVAAVMSALTLHHPSASTPVENAHPHALHHCKPAHYRKTMTDGEIWIASHETGDGAGSMDATPHDVNSGSGARELGQLLPSTFPAYGLHPSWNPCTEIKHLRVYIHGRYGNTNNAISFWRAHSWY